ncbi:MAG: hypothetical protein ACK4GL_04930 [Flavobacteriales bacterium]
MMHSLYRWVVYGNVWVALGALSMYSCTVVLANLNFRIDIGLVIFFSTLAVYNFHRIFRLNKLYSGPRTARQQWIIEHARSLWLITIASGVIIAFFARNLYSQALLISAAPAVLVAILYVIPVYAKGDNVLRLRDLPFLKLFLVAFTWAYVTYIFPLVVENQNFDFLHAPGFVFMFGQRLLFIFAITVPFDFRDLQLDLANGVKTFANQMGVEHAKKISLLCLALFALLTMLSFQIGDYLLVEMNALVLSAIFTGLLIQMANEHQPEWFFVFLLEGTMIDQLFWLAVLSYLFS